jgi:hypothetical protein
MDAHLLNFTLYPTIQVSYVNAYFFLSTGTGIWHTGNVLNTQNEPGSFIGFAV